MIHQPHDKHPVRFLTIDEHSHDQRLDNFLFTYLKSVPKSCLYRLIRSGHIRVHKKRIKPSYRLNAGDEIRLPPMQVSPSSEPPAFIPDKLLQLLTASLLYEDDGLFIFNKPSGVPVHGGTGVQAGMIEALRVLYPKIKQLELVHRLDKETSGCLMVSKKNSVLKYLHTLIRDRKIDKVYWALLQGEWSYPKNYKVDVALHKYTLISGARKVIPHKQGKPSVTYFNCIEQLAHTSFVEATLETGRTHQIRVHASHIGHPILGDNRYCLQNDNKQVSYLKVKPPRLMLHAVQLSLTLPDSACPVTIKAAPDTVWTNYIHSLKERSA